MVDILIFALTIGTITSLILISILEARIKRITAITEHQREYINRMEQSVYRSYNEHTKLIEEIGYRTEQNLNDVKAIADAVSIFSKGIGTDTVENKVKENIDLFGEWINGEE